MMGHFAPSTALVCLIISSFCTSSPLTPTVDNWCFVKDVCNQENPASAWNDGACKDGKQQSPIDIVDNWEELSGDGEIDWSDDKNNYDFTSFQMKNDGKHVELTVFKSVTGKKPQFTWADKSDTVYTLGEIHFHWGPANDDGTEHSFQGKKYAMEMHLTHYKSSGGGGGAYADIAEAKRSGADDAVATIAILFNADRDGAGSQTLAPVLQNLDKIGHRGDKISVESGTLRLSDILKVQSKVFTYPGSGTTPPCAEVVTWLVIPEPVNIRTEDVTSFREKIHGVDRKPLTTNRRNTQQLGERTVGIVNFKQ